MKIDKNMTTGKFRIGRKGLKHLVLAGLISLAPLSSCSKKIVNSTQNQDPVARGVISPTQGHAPLTVNFSGSASFDSDGFIGKYIWDFDDGAVDSTSGVNVNHIYPVGNYNPNLTVIDNEGARNSTNLEQIIVEEAPIIYVNVSGQLTDLLEGDPIQGALVSIGEETTYTGPNGEYSIEISPKSSRIVFEKNDFRKRETSLLDLTQDTSLNETMYKTEIADFFDEVVRGDRYHDGSGMNWRWTEQPKWYINTNPALGSGNQVTQAMIDSAIAVIQNKLPKFTKGLVDNPYIEVGTNPPVSGTEGWMRVYWRDPLPKDALGIHSETPDLSYPGRIMAGFVAFRTYDPSIIGMRRAYLQELSQVMGARHDTDNFYTLFKDGLPVLTDYTENDLKLGKVLYSRVPGNRYEDKDPDPPSPD